MEIIYYLYRTKVKLTLITTSTMKSPLASRAISVIAAFLPLLMAIQTAGAREIITPKDSVRASLAHVQNDPEALEGLLATYRDNGDSVAVAFALAQLGKCYNYRSDYLKAISYYQDAANLQKAQDPSDYINTLVSLATNCRRIGAYSSASEHLFEALDILEDNVDIRDTKDGLRQKSFIYNGLGNIYKYLDDGEEAEKYFRLSLEIDEKIGNELGQSMNWNTIGSIYEYRHEYDSAKVMYLRSLEHSDKTTSKNSPGICYNRLGQLAHIQGNIDEAEEYFKKAYDILTKAHDKWNLAKTTCNLGRIYTEKGNYSLAAKYLDESESLVARNRSYGHLEEIHFNRAALYEKQGQYKKASEEMRLCLAYADSTFAQRSGQEVAQTRLRYEQDRSEKLLSEMTREKEYERQTKRWVLLVASLVTLVLISLLVALLNLLNMQRKRNMALQQMNSLRNQFFSIVSHDLKNPITSQKTVLGLLNSNIESLPPQDIKEQVSELYNSSVSLEELLTDLLNWARIETGKIDNVPVTISLKDVASDAIEPMMEQSHLKKVTIQNEIDPGVMAFADRNLVSFVLRNLVSNAIKFSRIGGTVTLSSSGSEDGKIEVSVADHGIGISKERLSELFSLEKRISTRGTAGEAGSGLGLLAAKEMVELCGGQLRAESEEGKGSVFSFTLRKVS